MAIHDGIAAFLSIHGTIWSGSRVLRIIVCDILERSMAIRAIGVTVRLTIGFSAAILLLEILHLHPIKEREESTRLMEVIMD